jgi:hypothetical protein
MLSHEQPDFSVIRTAKRQEIFSSLLHSTGIAQPDAHQTAFALVGKAITYQLDHDRKSEALSGGDCLLSVCHDGFACKFGAMGGQHLLGFVFAQCA